MRKQIYFIAFTFLLVTLILARPAKSGDTQEPPVDCSQGGLSQYEMNVCAGRAAQAANKKLEALLSELQDRLDPQAREELNQVHEKWKALRDRDCKWEQHFFEGGSIAPTVYAYCIADQIQKRIDRLKKFLCEGAGMTGPCEASRQY